MKLFRKIRQKLIKEKNLKRYLLYAVGEILLLMIGIIPNVFPNDGLEIELFFVKCRRKI